MSVQLPEKEEPRFKIGQRYTNRGANKAVCTIVDVLKTYDSNGRLVHVNYVGQYTFCGQTMIDRSVTDTRIAMGLLPD